MKGRPCEILVKCLAFSGKYLEYLQTLSLVPKDPWTLRKQALPSVAPGTMKCPWLSWHNLTAGKGYRSAGFTWHARASEVCVGP